MLWRCHLQAVAAMDAGAERLRKVKSMGALKQVLAEQGAAGPVASGSEVRRGEDKIVCGVLFSSWVFWGYL